MKLNHLLNQIKNREPGFLDYDANREYAILVPLIEIDDEVHVLFQVRSENSRTQPRDICFPGGRVEAEDADYKACAIRETAEELGIEKDLIHDVTPLDYMMGEINLYPFLGHLQVDPYNLNIDKSEVHSTFTVPLAWLLEHEPLIHDVDLVAQPPEDFPYHLIEGGKNYQWYKRQRTQYFYLYEDKVIWGLTAKILHHFLEVVRNMKV